MSANRASHRLLVIRNDRLGDTILSLPVLTALRHRFPQATLAFLIHRSLAPLVERLSCYDKLLADDGHASSRVLAARLRKYQFDAAIVLNTNTRNAMAVWRAGIVKRVMWNGKLAGRLLGNANVTLRRSHPPVHETRFAMAFANRLAAAKLRTPVLPALSIPKEASQEIQRRLQSAGLSNRPLFGVHPGNRGSAFNWPRYRYAELVRELSHFGRVIVTGGPGEEQLAHDIVRLAGDRGTPMTGMSLLELASLLSELDAFVSSSTGPMHLAAWVHTPVVCLFSSHPAQVPEKWAPLGDRHTIIQPQLSAHGAERLRHDAKQMERIDVEPVLRAALAWLEHDRGASRPA